MRQRAEPTDRQKLPSSQRSLRPPEATSTDAHLANRPPRPSPCHRTLKPLSHHSGAQGATLWPQGFNRTSWILGFRGCRYCRNSAPRANGSAVHACLLPHTGRSIVEMGPSRRFSIHRRHQLHLLSPLVETAIGGHLRLAATVAVLFGRDPPRTRPQNLRFLQLYHGLTTQT